LPPPAGIILMPFYFTRLAPFTPQFWTV